MFEIDWDMCGRSPVVLDVVLVNYYSKICP